MYKVHIKNNHFGPDTFPNTAEGEEVFTITRERFNQAAKKFPDVAKELDLFVDWDVDHFAESMATADVLVTWNLPTENLAQVAPNLKWIHIIGAGVEHLTPLDWLPEGVVLTNNKGVHADKGGEFGLMSVLMLHNRIPEIFSNQVTADYDSIYSTPIAGKTLVVIGVGSIGKSVAAHCQRIGMNVIGVTRRGIKIDEVDQMVSVDRLDDVLPLADYVFVVTPLTPETENLLNRRRLNLLKKGAAVVNIGRAAVVDYEALTELLDRQHLSGAILDVFDPEPLPAESPLWKVKNLIITPHVSADDGNAYVAMTLEVFFENMRRLLHDEPLHNLVDITLGY